MANFTAIRRVTGKALFFLLCVIAGIGIVYGVGYGYRVLREGGAFSSWELLEGHGGFIEIVDANSQTVWARDALGAQYYLNINCHSETPCNIWLESESIPENIHGGPERDIERTRVCEGYPLMGRPPGEVVGCVRAHWAGAEHGTVTFFALLANGEIWKWQNSAAFFQDIFLLLLTPIAGLVVGFVLYVAFASRIWKPGK
jgi:hypothetical protein